MKKQIIILLFFLVIGIISCSINEPGENSKIIICPKGQKTIIDKSYGADSWLIYDAYDNVGNLTFRIKISETSTLFKKVSRSQTHTYFTFLAEHTYLIEIISHCEDFVTIKIIKQIC